jgi:putative endonuclease
MHTRIKAMGRGNLVLGKTGERLACRFLMRKGYEIIERNFKTPLGEIDLIAKKGCLLIFIEVKTRATDFFGPPYLAVTKRKIVHIVKSARYFLKTKKALMSPWRIDVVSVELNAHGTIKDVELFENVYQGD